MLRSGHIGVVSSLHIHTGRNDIFVCMLLYRKLRKWTAKTLMLNQFSMFVKIIILKIQKVLQCHFNILSFLAVLNLSFIFPIFSLLFFFKVKSILDRTKYFSLSKHFFGPNIFFIFLVQTSIISFSIQLASKKSATAASRYDFRD